MNRIKQLCSRDGITQKELASYVGRAPSAVSGWATGKYDIDTESLFRMADLFDCSIDYLLGRDFEAKKEAPQAAELSGMEETVLILFRGLGREDKAALLSYLHFLSYTHAQKEDAQRRADADTSAG